MKEPVYSKEKDELLRSKRGVGFEELIKAIKKGNLIKVMDNPNKKKYPRQKIFLVKFNNYVFMIPYIEEENYIFLKTVIPSRKYKKKYLGS